MENRLYEECRVVVRVNEFSYIIESIFFNNYQNIFFDNYKKNITN